MSNKAGKTSNNLAREHLLRVVHPTREGVAVDKVGYVDISSWSHATSKPFGTVFKPRRPEVGRQALTPARIGSIRAVAAFHEAKAKLAPLKEEIMRPGSTKFDKDEREQKVVKRTIAIALRFEEFYKSRVVSKAAPAPIEPPKPPLLKDCRRTDEAVIERLRSQEMPRE